MAAGKYSFTIEQGATTDFEIIYKDSTGSRIDLTGHQAKMQIRPGAGSSTVYLTLSSSLGSCGTGLNLSGSDGSTPLASGSIGVYISAHSSSLLDFDKARYDLELVTIDNNCATVTRVLEGQVRLSREITQGSY